MTIIKHKNWLKTLKLFSVLLILTLVNTPLTQAANTYPQRISVSSAGIQGDQSSFRPVLSFDGRYIAFQSFATNLVPDDTNDALDVFVSDNQSGEIVRVSVASDGSQGGSTSNSDFPAISANGRHVAFSSAQNNLVPGDTNNNFDIFVRDRDKDADGIFDEPEDVSTERVSVSTHGTPGNYPSSDDLSISSDGRYIIFQSRSTNLVGGETNGIAIDVFARDRDTDADGIFDEPGAVSTERVSVSSNEVQGNGDSFRSSISSDGRYVTFFSFAPTLVPGDTNNRYDAFVRDLQTGTTERVSVSTNGVQGNNDSLEQLAISSSGRYVVFDSLASNLVANDSNNVFDVFVRDRDTDSDGIFDESGEVSTERVSVSSSGSEGNRHSDEKVSISADGRYVTFLSNASNLVTGDTNGSSDVFIHDRQLGETKRVNVASNRSQSNNSSFVPSMSADGNFISYASYASNLVSNDTNNTTDVFIGPNPFTFTTPQPQLTELSGANINQGDTYNESGSFEDSDSSFWSATVDYGDGAGTETLSLDGTNFVLDHSYQVPGIYTVTVQIQDSEGNIGSATTSVSVENVAPTIGDISASPNPVQVNSPTNVSATVTDPGFFDTHTVSWNWGDNTTSTGTITNNIVSNIHNYTTAGVYEISLTVTDNHGATTTKTFQFLNVYAPTSQGLFTAGQNFTSPVGAFAQNPTLTGKVNFGLSYKYQGAVPTGNRQFSLDFRQANLEFNATTINALVISNGIATLTGTGTIENQTGTYSFLVVGDEANDTVRIQLKDAVTNAVIYDTQPGASGNATPTTQVQGNVIAH